MSETVSAGPQAENHLELLRLRRLVAQLERENRDLREQMAEREAVPAGGDGQIRGGITENVDDTARRQTEEALHFSESNFRRFVETSAFGVAFTGFNGEVFYANEAFLDMVGYSAEEVARGELQWDRITPAEFRHLDVAGMRELQATGVCTPFEKQFVRKDGSRIWVLVGVTLPAEPWTEQKVMFGFCVDITARKRAEEGLRHSEERFRRLIEASMFGVAIGTFAGGIVYANSAFLKMLGYQREDVEAGRLRWTDITPPDWATREAAGMEDLLRTGYCMPFEKEYTRKDGTRIPVLLGGAMMPDPFTGQDNLVGFCLDLTERKASEAALRRSERIYRAIGESIDFGIWVCDPGGRNIYASDSFLKLVGQTQEECSEFGWGKVLHPEDSERTIAAWKECVRTQGKWDIEHRFIRADGNVQPILARGVPVLDDNGKLLCWAGINLDISDLKRTEEALRRSNDDLRQFAYAASHDLQEPLRMMSTFSQLLHRKYQATLDEEGKELLQFVVQGAKRMDALLKDLLIYTRLGIDRDRRIDPVDCGEVLKSVRFNLASAIAECGAEIHSEALPTVLAHEVQMVQLFQNLVGNAIKYRAKERTPVVKVSARREGCEWIFSVEDNGIGIHPQHQQQVFGLFKRLHGGKYSGTGIGLTICRRIVEGNGGRMWVESAPGAGSTFHFTLPAEPEPRT